jgi:hypothetical protein
MAQALPDGAAERERLLHLQEQIGLYLSGSAVQPDEIEAQLLSFAVDQPQLLVGASEKLVSEVFQLLDPEIERFRRAKQNRMMTEQDRATLKKYVQLLESCRDGLDDANGDQEVSRLRLGGTDR